MKSCCQATPVDRSVIYQPAWPGYMIARRTLAWPSKTLFGSTIELPDPTVHDVCLPDREVEKLQKLAVQEQILTRANGYADIPRSLQRGLGLPDERYVPELRRLQGALKSNSAACKVLNDVELRNKYFAPPYTNLCEVKGKQGTRNIFESSKSSDKKCHTKKDKLVATRSKSYTDQHKPVPVHKYALMGDPVRIGGGAKKSSCLFAKREQLPTEGAAGKATDKKTKTNTTNVTQLVDKVSQNIKHKYGAKVCEEAITSKAERASRELPDSGSLIKSCDCTGSRRAKFEKELGDCGSPKREFSPEGTSAQKDIITGSPSYEDIGHTLRHNIPGYTYRDHKVTDMRRNFTQDVYDERVPEAETYKMRKDEHSKWAHLNVQREARMRAYDARQAEIKLARDMRMGKNPNEPV